jgi:multidrug efflux pump subunit AcrA (membrane-fusion protein)
MKFKALIFLLVVSALLMASCGSLSLGSPTPLPTVVLGNANSSSTQNSGVVNSGSAAASGVITPGRTARVSAPISASVQSLDVAVGDQVKAGQVLARLSGGEKLTAALEAANLELLSAQQAEKTLKDNSDKDLTAAQLRLANAQKALDDAKKRRESRQFRNGSQSQIDGAQANVILANNALKTAQDNYSGLAGAGDDNVNKAAALNALSAARQVRDRAVANLNYLLAMPNQIELDQAEAGLQSAQSEMDAASKEYDKLKNGLDPDSLALAEQRIKNAAAQIAAAQSAFNDLTLKAPFDGTVSKININAAGEWVLTGQPVLTLADLNNLRVETTDLSERNVAQVKVGQKVSVQIKALGQNVSGRVIEISPLADTLGGDVVYKTVIDLDSKPEGIRSGMTVDVQFLGQ